MDCNLGILFIIIDKFPNELLWRLWLEHGVITDTLQQNETNADTFNNAMGDESADGALDSERAATVVPLLGTPRVRIWFHAKFPERVTSPWVRARLVTSFHYKPEWGSLELTKVMVHLLHEVGNC